MLCESCLPKYVLLHLFNLGVEFKTLALQTPTSAWCVLMTTSFFHISGNCTLCHLHCKFPLCVCALPVFCLIMCHSSGVIRVLPLFNTRMKKKKSCKSNSCTYMSPSVRYVLCPAPFSNSAPFIPHQVLAANIARLLHSARTPLSLLPVSLSIDHSLVAALSAFAQLL